MANPEQPGEQREETHLVIEKLLEGDNDSGALYTIEHHLSADDLETLEKAAVGAFKLGYEMIDLEELEAGNGDIVICCDIPSECTLNADLIDAQAGQLIMLAKKFDVEYDGWGTYFKDPNGDNDNGEDFVDEDGDDIRH